MTGGTACNREDISAALNRGISGGNRLLAGYQQNNGDGQPAQASQNNGLRHDRVKNPPGQRFLHSRLPAGQVNEYSSVYV
jgi:hypothetical protein